MVAEDLMWHSRKGCTGVNTRRNELIFGYRREAQLEAAGEGVAVAFDREKQGMRMLGAGV